MWYLIGASRHVDGPSGSSQCVQGDKVCRRETVWIGNDICQEDCLLYSQRGCGKDETESGWQEREGRERRHVDSQLEWSLLIILHCLSGCWLVSRGWLVSEVNTRRTYCNHTCRTWICSLWSHSPWAAAAGSSLEQHCLSVAGSSPALAK